MEDTLREETAVHTLINVKVEYANKSTEDVLGEEKSSQQEECQDVNGDKRTKLKDKDYVVDG